MTPPGNAATHYDELGVSPSATAAEIRRVYLDLARTHHPDRLGAAAHAERTDAAARMARINVAWAVLSDDQARLAYNRAIGLVDDPARAGSSATVRPPGATWTPLDDADDGDVDPDLLDDTPTGAPNIPRILTVLPAGLGAAAVVALVAGAVMTLPGVLVLGVVLVAASALTFVLAPVLAMINSARDDRDQW